MRDDRPPLYNIHNNIPLPTLVPIIPCPDSDRCDTTDVHVHPPRRSTPVISSFCPTLGWLHLVKNVTLRATAHFALATPIVNPDWDVFWNLVVEEISDRLPRQCRARYIPAAFVAQLTWVFLCISVARVLCVPVCVSTDIRPTILTLLVIT